MLRRSLLIGLGLLLCACSAPSPEVYAGPVLTDFDVGEFEQALAESTRPTVVNVWASWCVPCRSEAPLLVEAHRQFGGKVDFVGIDIQDSRSGGEEFLFEFGIEYPNLYDPDGRIRGVFGGSGVPITFFVGRGGGPVRTHFGVIDEQALALQIDELLAQTPAP